MELPLLGKVNRPLPWLLGLMAGGILLVGTATYLAVNQSDSKLKLEELTVPAAQENLAVEIKASGTIEPIRSVNISPKNQGRLAKLLVEQGDRVKAGQTLAVMENLDIRVQGAEAEANLKQKIANLQQMQTEIIGGISQAEAQLQQAIAQLAQANTRIPRDIEQTRAQLRSAESRLKLSEQRVKRNQYLLEQGAISQDKFDEVVNEYQNAQANIAEIAERLEQLKDTGSPEIEQLKAVVAENQIALEQKRKTAKDEIAALQAQVQASQAALKQVEVQFNDTIITAPFDGIVTQRYAVEGAFVTPTTSASTTASATSSSILALAQGLEVVAKVPEVDIGQLQIGQKVRIVADAYPDRVFFGQVRQIAPEAVVEENVTSFEVKIALLTGQKELLSKMNVDVTFLGKELNNALVVPTVAIVTQEGQTGVMVVGDKDKPKFKPVTIGVSIKDKTQILSGLTPGEKVFIDLPEEKGKKEE
jgi:HlyD family secretion protein